MTSDSTQGGDSHQEGTVHVPVLLNETLQALDLEAGLVVVDGTCGVLGHGRDIVSVLGSKGRYVGLDRDTEILARARAVLGGTARVREGVSLHSVVYSRMGGVLAEQGLKSCDRVLLDIGISSMQIDTPDRGFSFQMDGPLDMRMDRNSGEPLAKWLARVTEEELANVIYQYGEERHSRRIARAILQERERTGIHRTLQLAEVIRRAMPVKGRQRIHPATRTFQALRIAINDELGELERGLQAALECLTPGGRLVVITFHSLEDRIVKRFMKAHMELPFRKPITASPQECRDNPRARSAKLRCGVKREAAA